jgi:hypothetical protein
MRFLYVDQSGRRVEVPTLEGLAARLELGALSPETMLYDSVADRWAPAAEHEFFRTIMRPPGREGALPVTPAGLIPSQDELVEPVVEASSPSPPTGDVPESPPGHDEGRGGLRQPGARSGAPEGEGTGAHHALSSQDFELSVVPDFQTEARMPVLDRRDAESGGMREIRLEQLGEEGSEPLPSQGETSPAAAAGDPRGDWRFIPGAPPPSRFELPEVEAAEDPDYWTPGKGTPPPSAPPPLLSGTRAARSPRRGPGVQTVVAVALVLLVAWFALDRLAFRGNASAFPADLEAGLSRAADLAFADMIAAMDSIADLRNLPDRPGQSWLEGVYLAFASRFEEEGSYWTRLEAVLTELQAGESGLFEGRLRARVEAMPISDPQKALLFQEGMRRFQTSVLDRQVVYDQASAIARGATELHTLLVAHESEILYEPFTIAGVSRDPVIEAVPTNRPLAEQMWALIDAVTRGLQDMDAIMGVSTRSFLDAFFRGLTNAGWE